MNLQSKLGITGKELKVLAEAGFSKEDWEKAFVLSDTEPDLRDPKDKEDLTNLLIQLMNEKQRLTNELLLLRKSHGFSDRLLCLVPLKHLERAYEPAKCGAEASRLERIEKDGNEVAANCEYHNEMRKVVFFTFLTFPMFLIDEILGLVRHMVPR
jgi:hypothetical protein